ncbi:hypothetical protein ACOSQ3_016020 [Xanthoceras sorbifolium]
MATPLRLISTTFSMTHTLLLSTTTTSTTTPTDMAPSIEIPTISSDKSKMEDYNGQETSEVKRALYHCNYCNKDITGKIRIKCAVCPDFDLCVECFTVGAELYPHKCNHPYRVMNDLSFPLLCPDWSADEEILLLEGIDMYGFYWEEVAKHVGTKTKEVCVDHYTKVYLDSPVFPLPDMSHAVEKSREELSASAKCPHPDDKQGMEG